MFQQTFISEVISVTNNKKLADELWNEIEESYTNKNRHYHKLQHLENLLQEILLIKNLIEDWQVVVFAIAYHDIIYDTQKQDNELKSAEIASNRLSALKLSAVKNSKCKATILATQGHQFSNQNDINLFTDADLSILGAPPFVYQTYANNIREEYISYPDFLYNPGRAKVLQHFLSMKKIFKTDYFFDKYEMQARENMKAELNELM